MKGLLFIKVDDLREARSLTLKGFQSVDENQTLLALYPTKSIELNGVDLNESIKAGPHPSTLSRHLRMTLFGEDGLTEDMIESENSPNRKEAKTELCMIFKGNGLVPLKFFYINPVVAIRCPPTNKRFFANSVTHYFFLFQM